MPPASRIAVDDFAQAAAAVVFDDDAGGRRRVGLEVGVGAPGIAGRDVQAGVVEPPRERPALDEELDLEAGQQDRVEHPASTSSFWQTARHLIERGVRERPYGQPPLYTGPTPRVYASASPSRSRARVSARVSRGAAAERRSKGRSQSCSRGGWPLHSGCATRRRDGWRCDCAARRTAAADVPERRRPGQLRRHRGRQAGQPRHRPDARRLRGLRGRRSRRPQLFRARRVDDAVPAPLHLGLLLDTSGSMDEDMELARSAAIKFLNTPAATPQDITLVDFDTEVRVARYRPGRFRAAGRADPQPQARGLDGAVRRARRLPRRRVRPGRPARSSWSTPTAATPQQHRPSANCSTLLKASDVTVYAVGFLEHQPRSVQIEQRLRLQQMAETTGGQAFFPGVDEGPRRRSTRRSSPRSTRSTASATSSDQRSARDGAWRKVEIKVVAGRTSEGTVRRVPRPPHRATSLRLRSVRPSA